MKDQPEYGLSCAAQTYSTKEELDEQVDVASTGSHTGARFCLIHHTDFIVLTWQESISLHYVIWRIMQQTHDVIASLIKFLLRLVNVIHACLRLILLSLQCLLGLVLILSFPICIVDSVAAAFCSILLDPRTRIQPVSLEARRVLYNTSEY